MLSKPHLLHALLSGIHNDMDSAICSDDMEEVKQCFERLGILLGNMHCKDWLKEQFGRQLASSRMSARLRQNAERNRKLEAVADTCKEAGLDTIAHTFRAATDHPHLNLVG